MKAKFPLFQSHLDLVYSYWQKLVQTGDTIIDATCGNGLDTLKLAQLCLGKEKGWLYAIDILPKAIDLTQTHLRNMLDETILQRVRFVEGCHSNFPEEIQPESVKLIVYNLGYLPGGGDKTRTTMLETTLESVEKGMTLIQPGGAISLTLYPGHPEGRREEENIISFAKELDPLLWNCCHHQWPNRQKSPSLLLLQRKLP